MVSGHGGDGQQVEHVNGEHTVPETDGTFEVIWRMPEHARPSVRAWGVLITAQSTHSTGRGRAHRLGVRRPGARRCTQCSCRERNLRVDFFMSKAFIGLSVCTVFQAVFTSKDVRLKGGGQPQRIVVRMTSAF